MTDVLLTHSYHLFYDRKQVRKMQPYPPLGTLYAAALLRLQGFSVAVFDPMLNDPEAGFADAVRTHKPRIVAVYEDNFNFLSKMCLTRMRAVAFNMLETARGTGAQVVVNGSDANDHVEEYLDRGFAAVLLGEAEWTLVEIATQLIRRGEVEWQSIAGITYREHDQCSRYTGRRELMRERDSLPLPARDLISVPQYRKAWYERHKTFSLNLVASRGCPYRCNWCAKPIYGNSFHVRSPESVAAEMRELKFAYHADNLWFADDIFALRSSWAEGFAAAVEKYDAALPFKIQSRADLMTERTVAALARAGCSEVWMGAESGSQRILDAMDKGMRVTQVANARETFRRAGIRACYFLQLGYPGESWEDIQQTISLVRETRPDDIGVSVAYPLPGTKFYERVRAELGAKRNWSDSDDLSVMFHGAYSNEFYRAVRDGLHAEIDAFWERPGSSTPADISDLWEKVERLEKTSRISARRGMTQIHPATAAL